MIPKLLAICCGALLLGACARRPAPDTPPPGPGASSDLVEEVRNYANPRNVPTRFQHLIDWQAGAKPVVLLFAQGGRRACAITPEDATNVIIGQRYRCQWSGAR